MIHVIEKGEILMEEKGQLGDKSPRVWSFIFDSFLLNVLVLEVVRSKDNFALVMFNLNVNPLPTKSILYSVNVWQKQGIEPAKIT